MLSINLMAYFRLHTGEEGKFQMELCPPLGINTADMVQKTT